MLYDSSVLNSQFDLYGEAGKLVALKRVSAIEGGEYAGPCPMCGGDDRFHIQPYHKPEPRWLCRQCTQGKWDSPISFVMSVNRWDFKTAVQHMGGEAISPEVAAQRATERAARAEAELKRAMDEADLALKELQSAQSWLRYHQNLEQHEIGRVEWSRRGIPDIYQDLFSFGYDPNHAVATSAGKWITPSLTIPMFEMGTRTCVNIRHRLLSPVDPKDKYRPERPGLPKSLWYADPDLLQPKSILIVEGEIKAAVSYITADNPDLQVIGIPGKSMNAQYIAEHVGNVSTVYLCYDPDAFTEMMALADAVGVDRTRVITLPMKIDDMIVTRNLTKEWIRGIMRGARKAAKL